MLQVKVVDNSIFHKKLSGCTCLSPPGVELEGSNDCQSSKFIVFLNGKVHSLSGWMHSE